MAEFAQYKQISSKLKKRFLLKKPNLNETSEQFQELSKELKDQKAYAGFCCLAVARCEEDLGHRNNQLQALLESARLFGQAQEIVAALDAYSNAIRVCDVSMQKPIHIEMAQFYEQLNRRVEAAETYCRVDMFQQAAFQYIEAGMFNQAFNCFHKCCADKLTIQELISSLLLRRLLFVNRDEMEFQSLSSSFSKAIPMPDHSPILYNKLTSSHSEEMEELYLQLQSLQFLLKQRKADSFALIQLRSDLSSRLTAQNQFLLNKILDPITLG